MTIYSVNYNCLYIENVVIQCSQQAFTNVSYKVPNLLVKMYFIIYIMVYKRPFPRAQPSLSLTSGSLPDKQQTIL